MARARQRAILALGLGFAVAVASLGSARWGLLFAATPLPPPPAAPRALSVTAALAEPVPLTETAAPRGNEAMLVGALLTATLVLGAASRARGGRRLGSVTRYATIPHLTEKEFEELRFEGWSGNTRDHDFTFWPGQKGHSWKTEYYVPPRGPARMCLSRVTDQKAKFSPSDFYKSPFAGLKAADIKQVSSYMFQQGEYVQGATFSTFTRPKTGRWMEKEKGDKLPAQDDKGYSEYVTKKESLAAVAPKQGVSMDKDFVADRSALTLLLNYLSETFSRTMFDKQQTSASIDLVKVSKVPGSKGLYLERIFDMRNVTAEYVRYRGAWKKSEMSNGGNFFPALYRMCAKEEPNDKWMSVTGIWQTAGSRAGSPDPRFRFVEYSLGGLDLLVRTRSHLVTADGTRSVELQHRNAYYKQKSTIFELYTSMLLGGTDMTALAFHRSGKLNDLNEITIEGLVEKQPLIVEAANRRFGRLVDLLSRVKEAMADVAEGEEYVLQWQRGKLVLGKYELAPAAEEKEKEREMA